MATVEVDFNACAGCGTCASLCPEIFELRDEKAWVIKEELNDEEKKCAEDAAFQCPVGAITVSD